MWELTNDEGRSELSEAQCINLGICGPMPTNSRLATLAAGHTRSDFGCQRSNLIIYARVHFHGCEKMTSNAHMSWPYYQNGIENQKKCKMIPFFFEYLVHYILCKRINCNEQFSKSSIFGCWTFVKFSRFVRNTMKISQFSIDICLVSCWLIFGWLLGNCLSILSQFSLIFLSLHSILALF